MGTVLPTAPIAGFTSVFTGDRRTHGAELSQGTSESSANIGDNEEDYFKATIPNLERFYEQMVAKMPEGHSSSPSWILSLARSYRRLSKEKRHRGRLRAM